MLYTETLGPLLAQVESTWNTFLMPLIGAPAGQYLELNIAEKLQGDFEEQATQFFQAVGGPYMAVNEVRKKMNLGPIAGGDELLAPLNMGAAGNNGPAADVPIDPGAAADKPPANTPGKANGATHAHPVDRDLAVKAPRHRVSALAEDKLTTDLKAFFARQQKATHTRIAAGQKADPSWWNQKSWNQELSAVLLPHMTSMSAGVARQTAGAKGLDPDAYSIGRTSNFLKSVADSRADLINATTRDRVKHAIDSGTADTLNADVDAVFQEATDARAPSAAKTMGTMLAGWAVTEVARQLLPEKGPQKSWVSSGLPNSRHADMDGETVGIDEKFSNGAEWPGDPVLGAEGVSNCGCGVDLTY